MRDDILLRAEALDVFYGRGRDAFHAVRDVSFTVGRERVGIVGESGSGKSTVGRAVMRLLPKAARIEAKRLELDGADLAAMPERELVRLRGRDMALVMQDPRYSLNPVLSIGRQVAESAALHLGVRGAAAREAARLMLDRVRIRDVPRVMDLYPHEVSGGMGQRVMIAMMLIAKPKLVIADEPTSALDVSVRRDILRLLDELVRENGSGLVLISHDIRMVAAFCDRILVMYKGRVVEELARLDDAAHPYTRGLVEALPDPASPTRHLKVLDRRRIDALEGAAR